MPALSGLVVSNFGMRASLMIDAISFIIFASLVANMKWSANSESSLHFDGNLNSQIKETAFSTVMRTPMLIFVAVGLFFASISLGAIHATEISYFKTVLSVPGAAYGNFISIAGGSTYPAPQTEKET